MGKGTKRCTGLYRAISVDCITLCAVVLKFQEWDIDKKIINTTEFTNFGDKNNEMLL